METVYLPKHLLMPLFHEKEIFYKKGNNPEQRGWLDLTVFGDHSVSLCIRSSSTSHGLPHGDGQILTNQMLDKIFWDEERKAFVGTI